MVYLARGSIDFNFSFPRIKCFCTFAVHVQPRGLSDSDVIYHIAGLLNDTGKIRCTDLSTAESYAATMFI